MSTSLGGWQAAHLVLTLLLLPALAAQADDRTVRVFVFAGQSNMVGADSKVADIARFPPFAGVEGPRKDVRFWYALGREEKRTSEGWVPLQPIGDLVGPELTFAREVTERIDAPLAIIKVAAGGTTLGRDWNPDEPGGFELYPFALEQVRAALAALDQQRVPWRLEGLVWHQGENDMFDEGFREAYGDNLARFVACWRRDLDTPSLRFYLGEHCTKTIWGMDNRANMHAIATGQRAVADADPLVDYVPTAHIGVEIGGGVGLHYHYGTLGQLEHGACYADAYLRSIDAAERRARPLPRWPYAAGAEVDLYVLAGHRNMEGERAFVQELPTIAGGRTLAQDQTSIAFRYATAGGVHRSDGWEPLGPAGLFDTFGPELSFGRALAKRRGANPVAIAKFTHSGSQILDWTPEGSDATPRNLYPAFLAFVREAIADLEAKGHRVRLAGICYHLGENDMSWHGARRHAARRLGELVGATREDLQRPDLRWFVSQQRPTDHESVNEVDVVAQVRALAAADEALWLVEAFDPPPQAKQLVLDSAGIVWLGEQLAEAVVEAER